MKRRSQHKKPSQYQCDIILKRQDNKCLYCGTPFIYEAPHFDHFIPLSFLRRSSLENFVAACQLCNNIKSDKVFDSLEDVRKHIRVRRIGRGLPNFPVGDGIVKILCARCGEDFMPKCIGSRFCSERCKVMARLKRCRERMCQPTCSDAPTVNP